MNISIIARKPFYDKFFLAPTMPGFLRLALIDSLSYNKNGLGGPINNYTSHDFIKNKKISDIKKFYTELEDIHEKGNHITNMLTRADLIQIGGAAAIQYCGGPYIDLE